jgi:hypothetical protein
MGGLLCGSVNLFAVGFIGLAFAAVFLEVVVPLIAKRPAPKGKQGSRPTLNAEVGAALEGLAKVLAALKDLPPWIAIFLAGLALAWTATSAPGLCT